MKKDQVLKYLINSNFFGIEVVGIKNNIVSIRDTCRSMNFTLKLTVKDNKITGHELY